MPKNKIREVHLNTESRRAELATLLKSGYDRPTITKILKDRGFYATTRTTENDIKILRARWRDTQSEGVEYQMHLDLARIDDALKAITTSYRNGNLHAIDRLINLVKLRSRLYGYLDVEEQADEQLGPNIYQINQLVMQSPEAYDATQRLRLALSTVENGTESNGRIEDIIEAEHISLPG